MSRVENRQSGPQVYNQRPNRQTYIAPVHQVPQPQNPQVVSVFRTSNVQPVITSHPVQPIEPSQPIQTVQRTSQFRTQTRVQPTTSHPQQRFTNYHTQQYKYNLFSMIDQPWNRCLQVGKCGSCPGNECIARQVRRSMWSWL